MIDTSALIAILRLEPDAWALAAKIESDPVRLISAATCLEAAMVASGRGASGERDLDLLVSRIKAQIVAFTEEQYELARIAFRRYGKGRHAAGLNFGDCISYSLAQHTGEPLLCKGSDFPNTDIRLA